MNTVVVTYWDGNDQVEVNCPASWEICPECEGKGKHVNPAVDGHGITSEEFREDPDFAEMYFAGAFDIACRECKGTGKILVADYDLLPDNIRDAIYQDLEEEARLDAISASERRFGC